MGPCCRLTDGVAAGKLEPLFLISSTVGFETFILLPAGAAFIDLFAVGTG